LGRRRVHARQRGKRKKKKQKDGNRGQTANDARIRTRTSIIDEKKGGPKLD